jgi:hypothetical protein
MTTEITLFAQPQPVPAYLQNNPLAKALQEQMEGGLAGRQINRISLRNGKFRFMKAGVEIAAVAEKLEVVMIAANPTVGRMFYIKAFDPDDVGQRPDCYSRDGVKPEPDSPNLQSTQCATCPQNAKGSAKNGEGKACAYKKRTIVVAPNNIAGDAYAVDAGSMSMFGDENKNQRLFNLKSYIEALKASGLIIPAVVTRMTFDDDATVPKLHFTPVRILTDAEFAQVTARVNDPIIREMLDDIDLKSEEGKPVNASPITVAPTGPSTATVTVAPAVPAAQPAPAAPARPRGRQPKTETAPTAAPAASGFPPVNGGGAAAPAPTQADFPPPAAAPVASAVPGFTVDLDQFDA